MKQNLKDRAVKALFHGEGVPPPVLELPVCHM